MGNATADFLGPEYSWSKTALELDDSQPLQGGVRVYVPRWTVGSAYVTRSAPGGAATKYRVPLRLEEKAALCRLLIDQDFLTIRPVDRPGLPDESRPVIQVASARRETHTVAGWAGGDDARFSAVYQALLDLAARAAGRQPLAEPFAPWQKAAAAGIGLLVFLSLGALGFALAGRLLAPLWPARAPLLLLLQIVALTALLAGLRRLSAGERRRAAWQRTFTNPLMLSLLNLLFVLAVIGVIGQVEALWAMKGGGSTAGSERALYVQLGWGALTSMLLLLGAAALAGRALIRLIDERF